MHRAAVAVDGPKSRRALAVGAATGVTEAALRSRAGKRDCTVDEAVDDTASHLASRFFHEDWSFVRTAYTVNRGILEWQRLQLIILRFPFHFAQPESAQVVLHAPWSEFVAYLAAQYQIDPQIKVGGALGSSYLFCGTHTLPVFPHNSRPARHHARCPTVFRPARTWRLYSGLFLLGRLLPMVAPISSWLYTLSLLLFLPSLQHALVDKFQVAFGLPVAISQGPLAAAAAARASNNPLYDYLPRSAFEETLLTAARRTAHEQTSVPEVQYNDLVRPCMMQLEAVRAGLRAYAEQSSDASRRPDKFLARVRIPPSWSVKLSADGQCEK